MTTAVEQRTRTFGEHLAWLRGKERPSDVARRVRITSQHLSALEERRTPGEIKPKTLMVLAEAYWEEHYPSREAAFWDLWQRAGYPLPPGWSELTEQDRRLLANLEVLDPEERRRIERDIADRVSRQLPPAE